MSVIFLASCVSSVPSVPRHNILGTTYGWNDSSIEVLLDASVDKLRIRHVRKADETCKTGYEDHLEISGKIGPDSTAAVERLLPQMGRCIDIKSGRPISRRVYLSSGGGYLSDGYRLGKLFRESQVTTHVTGEQECSSSCAIAFLGGKFRYISHDGMLMFHAPYIGNGFAIDCSDRGQVSGLKSYYNSMLGTKDGEFLLKRTLGYCSANSGWTLNAGAAKLFGITTN